MSKPLEGVRLVITGKDEYQKYKEDLESLGCEVFKTAKKKIEGEFTHVALAANVKGAAYNNYKEKKIKHMVSYEWLERCVEDEAKADEAEYIVKPPGSRKKSTKKSKPTKEKTTKKKPTKKSTDDDEPDTDDNDVGEAKFADGSSEKKSPKKAATKKRKRPSNDSTTPKKKAKTTKPKATPEKPKRAPKRKKTKYEGEPKKPLTAYFIYMGENRAKVTAENPDLKVKEIASHLGAKWRALTDAEKEPYNKKVEEAKKRYEEEMVQWEKDYPEAYAAKEADKIAAKQSKKKAASSPKKAASSKSKGATKPRKKKVPKTYAGRCIVFTGFSKSSKLSSTLEKNKKLTDYEVLGEMSHATHLVVGKEGRTEKVLNALAQGIWVLGAEWVEKSIENETWEDEEEYELTTWYPGCAKSRKAKSKGKRLFDGVSFFIGTEPTMSRAKYTNLIKTLGGKLGREAECDYIISGDRTFIPKTRSDDEEQAPVVRQDWLYDCMALYEIINELEEYDPAKADAEKAKEREQIFKDQKAGVKKKGKPKKKKAAPAKKEDADTMDVDEKEASAADEDGMDVDEENKDEEDYEAKEEDENEDDEVLEDAE